MVQGLAFLSKKSWHTKNLVNQERVWMAEQRKEAEANKTKELAKQIQQEREQEELDRISGKKTVMDRGIDWMYQGGTTGDLAKEDASKKAEEFLMGKEYVGEGPTQGDFDDGDQQQGIHNVVAHAAAAQPEQQQQQDGWKNEPSVKDRNESFRLRVEDPMFLVSRKELEKIDKHEQTKALYQRVVGHTEPDKDNDNNDKEDRRKAKKDRKRHKKKSSKRDDDSDRKSRRRRRSRSRSRSRSNERHRKHRRKERSYSRSRSSSEDSRDRHHGDERRREERNRRHREEDSRRKDHDDSRRDNRRDERRRDDNERYSRHRREGSEEPHHKRRDDRTHRSDERRKHDEDSQHHGQERSHHRHDDARRGDHEPERVQSKKKEGFGLKGAPAPSANSDDIGPCKELLQKKRETREAERRRIRETASSRRRTTDEERAKALQEMQVDARKREETMKRQASHRRNADDHEEAPSKYNASFLTDITKQTHGISGSASLSARVAQNRHTNQRLHDSFL